MNRQIRYADWLLDPEITFLNHGSFGACPRAVLSEQTRLRQELEQDPVRFFERQFEPCLDQARLELAQFLGANPANLVFVPNATTGVNAVLRSRPFQPGDELLTTNHAYNACRNALEFVAARWGAKVVVAEVPFPVQSAEQITSAILSHCSDRTRLALIDQVTSQTTLVMPVAQIVQALHQRGIETLIDGAHAPGMVELQLDDLGATYYTGNCHKWLCAPKGAAFLYVQPTMQPHIRPVTISHGANSPRQDKSRYQLEFDWVGTDDPTAYLCVPFAMAWLRSRFGDWPMIMQRNHDLIVQARQVLCEQLNVEPACPDHLLGSMAAIPLADGDADRLHRQLLDQAQIEVPVFPWPQPPRRWLRISAQQYNAIRDYEYLAQRLTAMLTAQVIS